MPTVTDLSFEELNTAATADSTIGEAVFTITGDAVMLDVKKLTGDSFTALTDDGACEMFYKLRKLCGEAQATVNTAEATDPTEELKAFPAFSYGIPSADGNVPVDQSQSFVIPLDAGTIKGIN